MRNTRLGIVIALALGCLTGCGADEMGGPGGATTEMGGPGVATTNVALPMSAPVASDAAGAGGTAPFPQFRSFANNWEDEDFSLTPELAADIAAHITEPIEFEIGAEITDYGLPYDAYFAREIDARDRFAAIHALNCEEIQSSDAYELAGQGCRQFVNRIFERSGRLRGTLAFAQRNYLMRMSDVELEALRIELVAIADSIGGTYERMRMDTGRGLLPRQQREDMQQAPGVLSEITFVWELRVLDEYLALDNEQRSLYRAAVRDWVGAE